MAANSPRSCFGHGSRSPQAMTRHSPWGWRKPRTGALYRVALAYCCVCPRKCRWQQLLKDRDYFMSAEEAKEYHLVDRVIEHH